MVKQSKEERRGSSACCRLPSNREIRFGLDLVSGPIRLSYRCGCDGCWDAGWSDAVLMEAELT